MMELREPRTPRHFFNAISIVFQQTLHPRSLWPTFCLSIKFYLASYQARSEGMKWTDRYEQQGLSVPKMKIGDLFLLICYVALYCIFVGKPCKVNLQGTHLW